MIGNIERVSNLFLTKTVYSVVLAFLIGITGVLSQVFDFEPLPYPFLPRHVTIAAWFTIGIPAFILSLAPNNERARTGFVSRVMRLALPSGLIIGITTFISYVLAYQGPDQTETQKIQAGTSALITLIMIAVWVLAVVARPYVWWKLVLIGGSVAGYLILFALPFTREFFKLDPSNVAATTLADHPRRDRRCTRGTLVVDQRTPARGETKDVRDARRPARRALTMPTVSE